LFGGYGDGSPSAATISITAPQDINMTYFIMDKLRLWPDEETTSPTRPLIQVEDRPHRRQSIQPVNR